MLTKFAGGKLRLLYPHWMLTLLCDPPPPQRADIYGEFEMLWCNIPWQNADDSGGNGELNLIMSLSSFNSISLNGFMHESEVA